MSNSITVYETPRRDFLYLATGAAATVAAGGAVWPLVQSLGPSKAVLSQATVEVDLSSLEPGQRLTVVWQKRPVFIDYRTDKQIAEAREADTSRLIDPATDADRVQRPQWLVVVGICTHLGCVPLGQKGGDPQGNWGGWYCPCHGSQFDTSGRVRKGPAPTNLIVPPYEFLDDKRIRIGRA